MTAQQLSSGIEAYRNGDKLRARAIFFEIVRVNPRDEEAWLWLSACTDVKEQQIYYLNKIISLNPTNTRAQKGLSILNGSFESTDYTSMTQQAKGKQDLARKQVVELTQIEHQIQKVQEVLATQTTTLGRRSKEVELEGLNHTLVNILSRHASEQDFLQLRQTVEPTVTKLLEEAVQVKRLQKIDRRNVPYFADHWFFGKRVEKYRTIQIQGIPLRATEEEPGIWSIGGKTSGECIVVYTIELVRSAKGHFEVTLSSDSSTQDIPYLDSEPENYVSTIQNRKQMITFARTSSTDLSEEALATALLLIIDRTPEVCPCYLPPPPPPPCHCDSTCSGSGCVYPHLGVPSLSGVVPSVLLAQMGHPSTYLKTIQGDGVVLLYHSLLGNLHYADPAILGFLTLADERSRASLPLPLDELHTRFPEVADLEGDLAMMRQLGLLVTHDEDREVLQQAQRQQVAYQRGELIRALRLNLTTSCNLACSYCHGINDVAHDELVTCLLPAPGTATRMPLEVACEAIRVYTDLLLEHGQRLLQIRYFGGEPLLNWPVLRESLRYAADLAHQRGLDLVVYPNTNGLLLTPAIVQELQPYRKSVRVIVSLDGVGDAHDTARHFRNGKGSFTGVWEGIELLREADLPFTISATLGAHNLTRLRELIDFLRSKDIHSMGIDPVRIVSIEHDPAAIAEIVIDAMAYGCERGFSVGGLWEGVARRMEEGATGAFCGGSGSELSGHAHRRDLSLSGPAGALGHPSRRGEPLAVHDRSLPLGRDAGCWQSAHLSWL